MTPPLDFSDAFIEARKNDQPIVALESTIISHGMPYPRNVETARAVEDMIRAGGAVPATIAIANGRILVGLSDAWLETLGRARDILKVSRADLAACLVSGRTGTTTVAATMICAHLAGIEVFATGGIGGVHFGAGESFDISSDLLELARTPVTVVASGAKAILDLPKTLEVLETQGVPVITYRSDDFPAFWSRSAELRSPLRMDTIAEIAGAHRMRRCLGLAGGQLIAHPIPSENEIPRQEIISAIEASLDEARTEGISAKQITPFLLQRIYQRTDGRSLDANIALVLNNAVLAAGIAVELHTLEAG